MFSLIKSHSPFTKACKFISNYKPKANFTNHALSRITHPKNLIQNNLFGLNCKPINT